MLEDVKFFDSLGIVPSASVRTLEDYLWEGEKKFKKITELKADPAQFVADQFGIKADVGIVIPSEEWTQNFENRFMTKPWPALYADKANFRKLFMAVYGKHVYWINRSITFGGIVGTILKIDNQISIPVLLNKGKPQDKLSEYACHETVHCVRRQHDKRRLIDKLRYSFTVEEAIAYSTDTEHTPATKTRTFPAILTLIYFAPLLAVLGAAEGLATGRTPYIPAGIVLGGMTLNQIYYANKTASFFRRSEEEGINPRYLFLRSNPSEYPKNMSITDAIYSNESPRFQIMAARLGIRTYNIIFMH